MDFPLYIGDASVFICEDYSYKRAMISSNYVFYINYESSEQIVVYENGHFLSSGIKAQARLLDYLLKDMEDFIDSKFESELLQLKERLKFTKRIGDN